MEAKKNKVEKLTTLQICNELKIISYYRHFVYKKYKGESFSSKDWKVKLKADGLDIK